MPTFYQFIFTGQWDSQLVDALENGISEPDTCCSSSSIPQPSIVSDSGIEEYVLQEAVPKHAVEMFNQTTSPVKSPVLAKVVHDDVADTLEKNLESLLESTQQDLDNLHNQLSGTDSIQSDCRTCQENQSINNKRLEELRIQVNLKLFVIFVTKIFKYKYMFYFSVRTVTIRE